MAEPGDYVQGLVDVDLDIYENEFIAVLGANGSGKSSLGRLLAGIAGNFSGELYFRGEKIVEYKRAIFNDVAMVIQEPQNQVIMPTVAEELSLPLRNRKIDDKQIAKLVGEAARQFGLQNFLDRSPDELSGGQITSLAIASSIITNPAVIIFDEPDSHLDLMSKNALNDFINRNRSKKTIILITQYAQSTPNAERVVILDKGKVHQIGRPKAIIPQLDYSRDYLSVSSPENSENLQEIQNRNHENPMQLRLDHVAFSYIKNKKAVNDINLTINGGEKIGLVGPIGSGKTTLGLLMAGLLKPSAGEIYYNDMTLSNWDDLSLRKLITVAIQLPERALFEETVGDDIAFGPRNLGLDNIDSIVQSQLNSVGIAHLKTRHPFTLSGGEKRKAALAGILAMATRVVILDEPSAGLDYYSTLELAKLLKSCMSKTLIIISHDLNLIKTLCRRIIGLKDGQIVCDLSSDNPELDNMLSEIFKGLD